MKIEKFESGSKPTNKKCRGASLRGQGTPALSCPPPQ